MLKTTDNIIKIHINYSPCDILRPGFVFIRTRKVNIVTMNHFFNQTKLFGCTLKKLLGVNELVYLTSSSKDETGLRISYGLLLMVM